MPQSIVKRMLLQLCAIAALTTVVPQQADAQLGALKKLKKALATADTSKAPDSAKAPDSTKKLTGLQKALGTAVKASDKFQQTTGMSVKDAALAASGAGIAGVAAKNLGLDPATLIAQATNKANAMAQQKASSTLSGLTAMAQQKAANALGANVASQVQAAALGGNGSIKDRAKAAATNAATSAINAKAAAVQQNAAAAVTGVAVSAISGKTMKRTVTSPPPAAAVGGAPDPQLMVAFQQQMLLAGQAAAAGDAGAKASLERWQKIANDTQPEMLRLSKLVGAGDMAAVQKLQELQLNMMRTWIGESGIKPSK